MKTVAVFCGSSAPSSTIFRDAAVELGRVLAVAGHTLVYGGSNLGLMGDVSGGALRAGGRVVAVIPTLFPEEIITSQTVSETIRVASMAERKERIIAMCDAFVVLPGGIGTLDELFEVMVSNQLRRFSSRADEAAKPVVLLNIGGFYDTLVSQLSLMRDEGLFHGDTGLTVTSTIRDCLACLEFPL